MNPGDMYMKLGCPLYVFKDINIIIFKMSEVWMEYDEIYKIIFDKILKINNGSLEGITLNDINIILQNKLKQLKNKVIESKIMDGSGDTVDITLYLFDKDIVTSF